MPEPDSRQAWFEGRWLPHAEVRIAADDFGFLQGVTVVERLRTFDGRFRLLDDHLRRLKRSARLLELPPLPAEPTLADRLHELVERNRPWCAAQPDVGAVIFATPGRAAHPERPTVGMHLIPLDWQRIARLTTVGQPVVVTDVVQPPPESWPRAAKCRSRVHFFRADRAARRADAGAAGILRDSDGSITETSAANVWIVRRGHLETAPPDRVLPGITQQTVASLATAAGLNLHRRPIFPDALHGAEEILLMGTGPGVWAAVTVNGRPVGDGRPGPVCRMLQQRLNEALRVDLAVQAAQAASP